MLSWRELGQRRHQGACAVGGAAPWAACLSHPSLVLVLETLASASQQDRELAKG